MQINTFKKSEYSLVEEGSLQIGDIVVTKHRHMANINIHQIDKITKTMGMCNCGNYVARYTIEIKWIHVVPRETWDMLYYRVYRKIE
jgi:hypothetical protein